ncbi:MAG: 1,4-dihydroxy-2-naphthoate octaprenyltransferase [Bacteroidales bacterium]|nr:1,4-dihydroxy-2-naphthoate octaprenyltransferase [Bacteroidales bacterium]
MESKWIEAMRLRTIPVSISGVLAGIACAIMNGSFKAMPALLCLLFAMLAQIASNFGNEYFDYKNGIDKKGREGFRRGVTEGEITPEAMKTATFATLALAAVTGCLMLLWGEWWMIPAGIGIGIFALAYSAGPYPLSHHGLGDIAVVLFFGVVPVTLTCWLQEGGWQSLGTSLPLSIAIGLMAANVLIVNNYRDMDDDRQVNKKTTVVIFGRKIMGNVYLAGGIIAMALLLPLFTVSPLYFFIAPTVYLLLHFKTWRKIISSTGAALNPLLGETARNLLIFTVLLLLFSIFR